MTPPQNAPPHSDVRAYFKQCAISEQSSATKAGCQLARSGINDMDTLCQILENDPGSVLSIRNIGSKSLDVIRRVCEIYLHQQQRKISHCD